MSRNLDEPVSSSFRRNRSRQDYNFRGGRWLRNWHRHLMPLFQMGRCHLANKELLYVVMQYAEEDLSQILPQRPLTPAETQDMLSPVLDVLAYLHAKGLVHGHLKSSNFMAADDQLKVSSDNLLKVGESVDGVTKPSAYDAPETASSGIFPVADIWSLGMILVECLTQHLPVWERAEEGDRVIPETLPEPFLEIVRNCLRRDPQHRWTLADINARLQPRSSVLGEQTTVRPPKPFAKWRYVVPTVVGLALMAVFHQDYRSAAQRSRHLLPIRCKRPR